MSDRSVEDQSCFEVATRVFEWLAGPLDDGGCYHIDGVAPVLLFSRNPDVWPLFVDAGDARYAIERDVTVRRVVKGSPADRSCTEEQAYPEVGRNE